jgi:hypothetical protein
MSALISLEESQKSLEMKDSVELFSCFVVTAPVNCLFTKNRQLLVFARSERGE